MGIKEDIAILKLIYRSWKILGKIDAGYIQAAKLFL